MPAIWSGTLTFGLVAIPVRVEPAVHSHRVGFRQIHLEDRGRVKYRKVCELEDDPHPLGMDEIGRAFETPDGTLVPLSDQELDDMPLPTAKTVEISGFVDLGTIPGEQFGTPYFLTPQSPAANKPYVLMREALARAGKGAIGKMAFRGTGETLAVIHAQGEVLVLQRLHWPDELRSADDARPREVDLTDEEIQAALEYITISGDLDLTQMRDDYAAAGTSVDVTTKLDFGAVKLTEQCPKTDEKPPAKTGSTMPNFVGKGLAAARSSLPASASITSTDASGDDRIIILESNWKICSQTPKVGSPYSGQPVAFTAVKTDETCP